MVWCRILSIGVHMVVEVANHFLKAVNHSMHSFRRNAITQPC